MKQDERGCIMQYYQLDGEYVEFVVSENIEKHFYAHNHVRHYIVSLVMQGSTEVFLENKKIQYCKDNIFIIPPYVRHSVYQNKDTRIASLCIGTDFIEKNTLYSAKNTIKNFLDYLYIQKAVNFEQAQIFNSNVDTIYSIYNGNKKEFDKDISVISNRIIRHPEQELTINDLADDIFISKYHFIRKFKNCIGMTPHQFQIQNRIRKSQKLLNDEKSVVEVSYEMGFYDQSHFDKSFYKIVGISPTEYIHSKIIF